MSAVTAKILDDTSTGDCCGATSKLPINSRHSSAAIEDQGNTGKVSFSVDGMTCMSCARRIEAALLKLPGVSRASVDLSAHAATIHFDPDKVAPGDLKSAIESAGYTASENRAETENQVSRSDTPVLSPQIGPYPVFIGIVTALGVVGFYLGLLTITSDWSNAKMQFEEYRWWIIALSLGLGTQVTLFTFMRKKLLGRNIKAAKSGLATSGGMSTASMAACCAHYLVPLLPVLGLPFLSAAVAGIATYQTEIFMLGVFSNLIGLGIMLRLIHRKKTLN